MALYTDIRPILVTDVSEACVHLDSIRRSGDYRSEGQRIAAVWDSGHLLFISIDTEGREVDDEAELRELAERQCHGVVLDVLL